jgi:DNA-binding NarL/FixJ family response regulator
MVEANSKITVIIADQQPLFRRGIHATLSRVADIEILEEAGSGQELTSAMNLLHPDVVILDTDMSPQNDMSLAKAIKQQLPSVAVVLLTANHNDAELFEAIRSRAAAYLSRDVTSDELVAAIRKAANGQHPINDTLFSQPKVAEKVLQQFQDFSWGGKGVEVFVSPLTPRETEILNYIAKGHSNKQIALVLSISEQTIKNHITSILRKLDANARTEAVVTAIKRGLITLS